jgi:hypothetical protein
MNEIHRQALLSHFNLGTSKSEPQRVYGGLLHTMWRIETENKIYAVKQLSPDIDLTDKKIIRNYNLTEEIATIFIQQNIPAVSAIEVAEQYLYCINDLSTGQKSYCPILQGFNA